jgi:hypothetical protein
VLNMWEFITEGWMADSIKKGEAERKEFKEASKPEIEDDAKFQHHINQLVKHGKDDPITSPHRIAKALDNATNYAMDGRIATHLKDIDPHRTAALAAALAAGAGAVHLARKLRKSKRNK